MEGWAIGMLDERLFFFLNKRLTSPFLDLFMPWITDVWNLVIPLLIVVVAFLAYGEGRRKKVVFIIFLIIGVVLTDKSSAILKDVFHRVRPCNIYEYVRVLVGCTSSFSMPSSHAANTFFIFTSVSYFYRKALPFLLLLALAVSYSRIYVGVHYPGDVIAGALLGMLWGILFIVLVRAVLYKEDTAGREIEEIRD